MSDRLVPAVVTFLTVVALVVGAPALEESAVGTDSSDVGTDQQRPDAAGQSGNSTDAGGVVLAVVLSLTVVALGYGLRQYGRDDAVLAVLTTVGLSVAALVAFAARDPALAGAFDAGANGSVVDSATTRGPTQESLWLVGAVGSFAVVALAAVVLVRGTGTETWESVDDESAAEADDGSTSQTALGEAAGRAADRIASDASLDNAVYRAWREMTDALDVPNPEACTPGEFAVAAERAGMDPDDVAALTDLFESVRYGDRRPTEERERRAQQALRDIERAYGGES